MKILEIRLKNLNSLRGEWRVDLSRGAFAEDGIFTVTGPTGSGKTTLFDAICLALYGQTPRLNKITASANEIMSRRTSECFAQTVFMTRQGCFVCRWSQKRAGGKCDGRLQPASHELSEFVDGGKGRVIASTLRDTPLQVEAVTGMDFARFTRAVLLAQGRFDAFLKAGDTERGAILEMITGINFYSELSQHVFARHKEEEERLNELKARRGSLTPPSLEEEKDMRLELARAQAEQTERDGELEKIRASLQWLKELEALRQDLKAADSEAAALKQELEDSAPELARLEAGRRAAALEGEYVLLTRCRLEREKNQAALLAKSSGLPLVEQAALEGAAELAGAIRAREEAQRAFDEAGPLLKEVRARDQSLNANAKAVDEAQKEILFLKKKLSEWLERQALLEKRKNEAALIRERAREALEKRGGDEQLETRLSGIEERVHSLKTHEDEFNFLKKREDSAREKLTKAQAVLSDAENRLAELRAGLDEAVNASEKISSRREVLLNGRMMREYRAELEHRQNELRLRQKIISLESERKRLRAGAPCPLCGSTEHPYAAGITPELTETERAIDRLKRLIANLEELDDRLEELKRQEDLARAGLTRGEGYVREAQIHVRKAQEALNDCRTDTEHQRERLRLSEQALYNALTPLDIFEFDTPEGLLSGLKGRLETRKNLLKRLEECEERLASLANEGERANAEIKAQSGILQGRQAQLDLLRAEGTRLREERRAACGNLIPDEEESRLRAALNGAAIMENEARQKSAALERRADELKNTLRGLTERLESLTEELKEREENFFKRLDGLGFSGEELFLSARLDESGLASLEAKEQDLRTRGVKLESRRRQRQEDLERKQALALTDEPVEALKNRLDRGERELLDLRERAFHLKEKIKDGVELRRKFGNLMEQYRAQERETLRWTALNRLIGSSDGKKYGTFAQEITLDIVLEYANRQLQKMNGRYLLIRQEGKGLCVIDSEQAGEVRPTANLSGGESFIVSLALALGLSQMSGRQAQVDSLFLDEGFGSLDDEALETALEALGEVRREGRTIGIISHVQALKDRVAAQIEVVPRSEGVSILRGPGCEQKI